MSSGNICHANPFPNKYNQPVCLCKSEVTHVLPYHQSARSALEGDMPAVSKKSLSSFYPSSG